VTGPSERRPNPDELLRQLQADERRERRGQLKVFLGHASRVGKSAGLILRQESVLGLSRTLKPTDSCMRVWMKSRLFQFAGKSYALWRNNSAYSRYIGLSTRT
jgi:hypothetical protein